MATQQDTSLDTKSAPIDNHAPEIDVEKHTSKHQETVENDDEIRKERGDYSGAVKKTDPAEVKLVRKLDIWIMVRFPNPPEIWNRGHACLWQRQN
jgi:hypothetical protein